MDVALLSHTPDALELLLFTKNTRLTMTPDGLEEVKRWPSSKKAEQLRYMLGTIQSSWEFVDYVFLISGVTRNFTHQLVRHRVGTSFAQQSQRVLNMSEFPYHMPRGVEQIGVAKSLYEGAMSTVQKFYRELTAIGVHPEDARAILPNAALSNIVFKANLRALHDLLSKRLCYKAEDEFRSVAIALRNAVLDVHPWAERFLRVHCASTGTCCFEAVKPEECPVKPLVLDPATGQAYQGGPVASRDGIQQQWNETLGTEMGRKEFEE